MISHLHRCLFTHIPKTAGKSVQAAFGLPMLGKDYDGRLTYIAQPFGHHRLVAQKGRPEFDYFKFTFVRNPWERLVSAYFYLDAGGCNPFDAAFSEQHLKRYGSSFTAFVDDLERNLQFQHFLPQSHWVADDDGVLLADFVGRFERLQDDFAVVAERLRLDGAPLPVLNRSEHRPYRDCYTARTRAIVERLYGRDIELFAYDF